MSARSSHELSEKGFMNKLSLYLKGVLMGFAGLAIPGLSASTIAIVLMVYYDMIYAISHILKQPKKSIPFLACLIAGYGTGGLVGAIAVNVLYINFPVPLVAAVLGFLLGSIPRMTVENRKQLKKPANLIVMAVVAAIFLVYAFTVGSDQEVVFTEISFPFDYVAMFCVGLVTSVTLVIPGVDFAVTLMAMGYYYALIDLLGNLPSLLAHPSRLFVLLTYVIGYGVGAFLFSKGLRYLIKRFPDQVNCVNLALVLIAPLVVIKKCVLDNANFAEHCTTPQFIWAAALFAAGFFAYTWVPILLRYFGLIPKDTAERARKVADAARSDIPRAVVIAAEEAREQEEKNAHRHISEEQPSNDQNT